MNKDELLKPEQMTKSWLIDKELQPFKDNLPIYIKKSDAFQVLGYTLKVREEKFVHLAHELPAQHYQSITTVLKKYLSDKISSFNLCFCPIYFITSTDFSLVEEVEIPDYKTEKLRYVGKTNNKSSRFHDGHRATQKLNELIYKDTYKTVYMTQVYIDFKLNDNQFYNIALEWLEFEEENVISTIIDFIEKYLIFGLRPELNEMDNPAYQTGQYIEEPALLSKYHLKPGWFKVVGVSDSNKLLHNLDVIDQIEKLKYHLNESIEFFQKYGLLPR